MLNKLKKPKENKNNYRVDKAQWEQYLKETKGLERDYMAEIVKSRAIWQRVAMLCMALTFVAVLWHQFNPITHKEPFVLRVNNTTGAVDMVSTVKDQEKTYGEVVDTFFIADYVRSYESYNYHSIQDNYDKTILMSADDVANGYRKIYEGSETTPARDAFLGQSGTRKVEILSVVPDIEKGIATVRFQTTTAKDNQGVILENWVATLTYEYVSAKIDENVRLLNPLGFVVTSYRVDKELGS